MRLIICNIAPAEAKCHRITIRIIVNRLLPPLQRQSEHLFTPRQRNYLRFPPQHEFLAGAAADGFAAAGTTSAAAGAGVGRLLVYDKYAVQRTPHADIYKTWYLSGHPES
ncbi:hypothetical protein Vretimale_12345 [Volvox reticuliferus]|uniref:Uncharacterized protein n=1 Tax=Volvox reticuliferus TaxID=1737510 RepID=A0A8J4GIC0_9CHLO|nr:hypothetical protein Vretimale_12345 [Volvox reticuliferus]